MKDSIIQLRISNDLKEEAKIKADKENRTLSNYITNLITQDLENRKEEKQMGNEFKSKGYINVKTSTGTITQERVYGVNGTDCVNLDIRSTAKGNTYRFFNIKDVEINEDGYYTNSRKNAVYEAKGNGLEKFEKFYYSITEDEKEYIKEA